MCYFVPCSSALRRYGKACIRHITSALMSEIFLPPSPPLDEMLVHRRVTPSVKYASTHLYT